MRPSVIIPAFNAESTVVRAMNSALRCELVHEVVVVDDGSIDGTAGAIASVADERVRMISQENAGRNHARNAGAASSTGTHLLFLDADDCLVEDAPEILGLVDPGAALVRAGGLVHELDGNEQVRYAKHSVEPFPRGTVMCGSFVIERELFLRIGGYDPLYGYGENSELLLRARIQVDRQQQAVQYLRRPLVHCFRRGGRADEYREVRLASTERFLALHGPAMRDDVDGRADLHSVCSELHRSLGHRRQAAHHAATALRLRPREMKSWLRFARVALAPGPNCSVSTQIVQIPTASSLSA